MVSCQLCYHSTDEFVKHTIVNKELWFVEMYVMMGPTQYIITLSMKDNQTYINTTHDDDKDPIIIEGFPLTFDNVKKKLKLYLLFS